MYIVQTKKYSYYHLSYCKCYGSSSKIPCCWSYPYIASNIYNWEKEKGNCYRENYTLGIKVKLKILHRWINSKFHAKSHYNKQNKQTNKEKITPFCTYGVRLCNSLRRCSKHHQHKQKLQLPNAIWVSQITSQSIWPEFLSFFTSTYAKFLQCAVVRIKKNGTNWTSSSF